MARSLLRIRKPLDARRSSPASISPRGRTFMASTIRPPNNRLRQSPRKRSPSIRKPWMKMTASKRAEHVGEPAEDRIGDREGREHDAELRVLDMRGVVGEDAAAETGDEAADGHRGHLDGGDVDAGALRGELVLADRAQHGAGARAVHPPQCRHHQRDEQPDEQHHVERRPAVLREIADLPETFAAMRAELALRRLAT